MTHFRHAAIALALLAGTGAAYAQTTVITQAPPPDAAVTVPPGYTTYYISGTPAGPMPSGQWGDTTWQTADSLNKLEATLKQLGLGFGDVVKAAKLTFK